MVVVVLDFWHLYRDDRDRDARCLVLLEGLAVGVALAGPPVQRVDVVCELVDVVPRRRGPERVVPHGGDVVDVVEGCVAEGEGDGGGCCRGREWVWGGA